MCLTRAPCSLVDRPGIHFMNPVANTLGLVRTGNAPWAEPGTVAICFVIAALEAARDKAVNVDSILSEAGISPELLDKPHARIPAKQYGALWRLLATQLDDELFGQDSRRMKSGTFAMICHAALSCDSLRQALERALRFFRLVLDDISGDLLVGNTEACLQLVKRDQVQCIFGQECLLMLLHGLACWLVGKRIPIVRAEFSYAEPAHSIEYRSMYAANLEFQKAHTAIFFDRSFLALPIVQNRRSIKDFLRCAPDGILVKYKSTSGLAACVRRRLRRSVGNSFIELDAMAADLGLTSATFRRRLHAEGTSYRLVKDQVRRDLAVGYLSSSDRSTAEIGWDLGFSERSAFERAFRNWTGVTPGEFRRRRLFDAASLTRV
jgi:AraC-like DNA-binding protein